MQPRLLGWWAALQALPRNRWRWVGYALTAAGLAYVLYILIVQGRDLAAVDWGAYLWPTVLALLVYLLSLLVQFFVWLRVLAFHRPPDWHDVDIYARMIITRRLPGGFWHWLGRAAMYTAATQLPTRVVVAANFIEWGLLIVVGAAVYAAGLETIGVGRWLLAAAALAVGLALAAAWQPRTCALAHRLAEGGLWSTLFAGSWLLGGLIVWLYTNAGGSELGWLAATHAWALAGVVGLILTIVPAVFGIQEVTLTVLLQPALPQATALLAAVLLRLVFTLADVLWGLVGWGIAAAVLRQRGPLT